MRLPLSRKLVAIAMVLACTLCFVGAPIVLAAQALPSGNSLWAHDNLHAWCVLRFDDVKRSPTERAKMLRKLGFNHFAYNWRKEEVPSFDAEIEALKQEGITLVGWALYDPDVPGENDDWTKPIMGTSIRSILETFKRHHIRPRIWLVQPFRSLPGPPEKLARMSPAELQQVWVQAMDHDMPKTPEEQERRIAREADRVHALVKLAAPYGVQVALYTHNGWFGSLENNVAVIERLKARGVTDLGIVYNFSHMHDELHDDSVNFLSLWLRAQPYVVAINITGTRADRQPRIFPSQGDADFKMLKIIQDSGWKGSVGLIAENRGDAELTLGNALLGLDWLAAELNQPGAGGPRPFPPMR